METRPVIQHAGLQWTLADVIPFGIILSSPGKGKILELECPVSYQEYQEDDLEICRLYNMEHKDNMHHLSETELWMAYCDLVLEFNNASD